MKYRPILILAAAFMAGMLSAIFVPRESPDEGTNWLIVVTVAVVAGAIAAFATHQRVDESA